MLEVRDLTISLHNSKSLPPIVDKISFDLDLGQMRGIVGESGCGKSLTCHAIIRLLNTKTFDVTGSILFEGVNLLSLTDKQMRTYRGKKIGMIFQEAQSSLNPTVKVGSQIIEILTIHNSMSYQLAKKRVLKTLEDVQITDPASVYEKYPFELSGGMQQRVMIAMAIINEPNLLIADEPTTALDVTVQAQVLKILKDLQDTRKLSILFVSHNLSLIAQYCNEAMVLYAGKVVEHGHANSLFDDPQHPYTKALVSCLPILGQMDQHLKPLQGKIPNLLELKDGCRFKNRCVKVFDKCNKTPPVFNLITKRSVSCWHFEDQNIGG